MNTHPPVETGASTSPSGPFRKLRILIADDNRDTVLTLMMLLQDEGHEVRAAHNGADALRIAKLHHLDVVILDIEMPEVSGYAIAQDLRTHYYPHPPMLIAISGKWNKPSEKLLAHAVGFHHHLEKPCDPRTLLRLLKPLTLPQADGKG